MRFRKPSVTNKLLGGALIAAVSIAAAGGYLFFRSPWKTGASGGPPPQTGRLVLVVIDALRADGLGCYGYPRPTSPSLDSLAHEGVLFERFYAASSWTLPSFASILTGVSPSAHGAGAVMPDPMMTATRLPTDVPMLTEELPGAFTAAIVNNTFLGRGYGLDRGFEHFDAARSDFAHNRSAADTTDAAIALLRRHAKGPLFLMIHYFDPHTPYVPPQEWETRFEQGERGTMNALSRRQFDELYRGVLVPKPAEQRFMRGLYDGEVAYTDAQLGRLVDWMREEGLLDDTWLVVTADHGEEHWDHGEFEHGHRFENEVTRVPLVIRAPGGSWHAGERVATSARHIDLAPTILRAFGKEPAKDLEGESVFALVGKKDAADRPCYMEFHRRRGRAQKALFDGRYKIITETDGSTGYFYDLQVDPGERHAFGPADPRYAGLKRVLDDYPGTHMRGAARKGDVPDISPAVRESLQSLGYMEGNGKVGATSP